MADAVKQPVRLEPEDRARMARLYEEVVARLNEMGHILSRTLDVDLAEHIVVLQPRHRGRPDPVQILAGRTDDSSACYSHREGTVSLCGQPWPWVAEVER